MVSTHHQYLCPDFLNPSPPTTMDSSPLALLAQTCNSIGLPDPPSSGNASVNGASSKSAKSDNSKSSDSKSQTKDETSAKGQLSKKTTTSAADSSSDSSSVSAATVRSPPASKDASGSHSPETNRKTENRSRNAGQNGNVSSSDNAKPSEQSSADAKVSSAAASAIATSSASAAASSLLLNKCMVGSNPMAAFSTGAFPPALFPSYFPTVSTPATAFPYGTATHMPSFTFAGSCYPPFGSSMPTASNPWMPPPLPGFTPKCTDPFCKTCPAIAGATAAAVRGACGGLGCPCLQCGGGHSGSDLPLWLSSYGSLLGQTVGLHGGGSPMGTNPASVYAAAAAAAAAAQQQANSMTSTSGTTPATLGAANQSQQQHTCSWMTGSEFCGKRFSSSEELLQHLRSHTSHDSAAAAAATAALSTPTATSAASAVAAHLTGRLSPRSTYLSSLNSLRYHPYSKLAPSNATASAAAAAAALASLPFPTGTAFNPLSALCSTLSAQRLPASLPHP